MTNWNERRPSALDNMGSDLRTVSLESDTSVHSYVIEMQPSQDSPRARRPSAEGRRSAESRRSAEGRDSAETARQSHDSGDSRGSGGSAFATAEAQATPMPRDSLEVYQRQNQMGRGREDSGQPSMPMLDERHASMPSAPSNNSIPTPRTRMDAFRGYRQQLGTRGAFSLDMGHVDPSIMRAHSRGLRVSLDLPPIATAQDGSAVPVYEALEGRLVRRRRRLPIQWVVFFGAVSSACLIIACTTLSIGIYNFTKLRANRAQKSISGLEDDLLPVLGNISDSVTAVQLGIATLLARQGGFQQGPPP